MKHTRSNKLGIGLVTCAALSAIVFSQVAYAKQRGGTTSGVSELVGRSRIRPDDPRFQPAAMMFVNEAEGFGSAAQKGGIIIVKTMRWDVFDHWFIVIPPNARGAQVRPLTPSELLVMEELFSRDLSNARDLEVNGDGISGKVTLRDLKSAPTASKGVPQSEEMMEKTKARGAQKSEWYRKAAAGL